MDIAVAKMRTELGWKSMSWKPRSSVVFSKCMRMGKSESDHEALNRDRVQSPQPQRAEFRGVGAHRPFERSCTTSDILAKWFGVVSTKFVIPGPAVGYFAFEKARRRFAVPTLHTCE